jgi:hypothetical protein
MGNSTGCMHYASVADPPHRITCASLVDCWYGLFDVIFTLVNTYKDRDRAFENVGIRPSLPSCFVASVTAQ